MKQEIEAYNNNDENGNPAGGSVKAIGLEIEWQNGPLGRDGDRIEPNGSFVETVISAALQRIEYYQASKFNCHENENAIKCLEQALQWCNQRTVNREVRQVEGTHNV